MACMRKPDRPDSTRPGADNRADDRGHPADLAARLLRLPSGHPSGAEEPERDDHVADTDRWWEDAQEAGSADFGGSRADDFDDAPTAERQGSLDDCGNATGAEDDVAAETGDGHGGKAGRGLLGARDERPARFPASGREPYRPWFTGESVQPWFASGSDALLPGADGLLAGADGLLSEPDDPNAGHRRVTPGG